MPKKVSKLSVASGPQKTSKKLLKKGSPSSSSYLATAPAAVSGSMMAGIAYSSVSSTGKHGLRVTTTVPICEIGNSGDAYANGLYVQNASSGATYSSTCSVTPYNLPGVTTNAIIPSYYPAASWISPHVPLMALAFDRYRVESLEFVYEPQSTSTNDDRLVFAWTDDPAHPFLSPYGQSFNSIVPTQLQLLVTRESTAFMPWKPWRMKVPVGKDLLYMYNNQNSEINYLEGRLTDFGCFSCIGSALDAGAKLYGILYVKIVLDLYDPVPIISSINAILPSLHAMRSLHRKTPTSIVPFSKLDKPRAPVASNTDESKQPIQESKLPSITSVTDDDYELPDEPPKLVRTTRVPLSTLLPLPSSSTSPVSGRPATHALQRR
jgi:hypothetical protein